MPTHSAIPDLRTIAPRYMALTDRLGEISRRWDEVCRRLVEVRKVVGLQTNMYEAELFEKQPLPQQRIETDAEAKAREMLGELAPAVALPPSPRPLDPIKVEAQALAAELDMLTAAQKIVEAEWHRERPKAMRLACEFVGSDYVKLARRLCLALVDLGSAQLEHDAFTSELQQSGVDWAFLRPVLTDMLVPLGDPRDPYSPYRQFLDWAAEVGHIDNLTPDAWRR